MVHVVCRAEGTRDDGGSSVAGWGWSELQLGQRGIKSRARDAPADFSVIRLSYFSPPLSALVDPSMTG